jgi:hypothetical protein
MRQRERAISEDLAGQDVVAAAERGARMRRIDRARKTEVEIQRGIASAAKDGRGIVFTAYRTLSDLFETSVQIEDLSGYKSTVVHKWPLDTGWAELSSFCTISGADVLRSCLDVRPRKAVIDAIGERMIMSDGYSFHFEVVARGDGTALVLAKYNQIIGSRWLAIIHAETVPGFRK